MAPGKTIDLPLSWASNTARYVVVLVSSTCPACEASRGFYRALGRVLQDSPQVRLAFVAYSGSATELETWVRNAGVQEFEALVVTKPDQLGFFTTPTLLILEPGNRISDVLLHQLSPQLEAKLFERVLKPSSVPVLNNTYYADEISLREAKNQAGTAPTQWVDARRKDGIGRILGWFLDVHNRVTYEDLPRLEQTLSRHAPVILRCDSRSLTGCRRLGMALRDRHFEKVSIAW